MAVLWLTQLSELSPGDSTLNVRFRQDTQRILQTFASWRGDKYKVCWVNNIRMQGIQPEDCLVYFANNFSTGAARSFYTSNRLTPDPAMLALVDPLNFTELGITVRTSGLPTVSEVHTGKCLHRLRQLRRHRHSFRVTETTDYPIVLAAVAWHEAMHNKVEPQMGRGWDLHTQGGGAWATTLPFGPAGGLHGARAPSQTNLDLMRRHFAAPVPQFVL